MPCARKLGKTDVVDGDGTSGGVSMMWRREEISTGVDDPESRRTMYASVADAPGGSLRGMLVTVPGVDEVVSGSQTRTRVPGGNGSGICGL